MLKQLSTFLLGAVFALGVTQILLPQATAYDPGVYDNLQRTRDALLDQRKHLQDVYDQISTQISQLQQKQSRIDSYLGQNDRALRDVESAISKAGN